MLDGHQRASQQAHFRFEMVGKLVHDVRIEWIDGRDVDGARSRIAPHGDGHEAPAHLLGQVVHESRERYDAAQRRKVAARQLLLEHFLGQIAELEHRSHEGHAGNQVAMEAGFDFGGMSGSRCDEPTPELDGHIATISLAPRQPRVLGASLG